MKRSAAVTDHRMAEGEGPRKGATRPAAVRSAAPARRESDADAGGSRGGSAEDEPVAATLPAVVGIGSSAGGLDALTRLFHAMPADSGMAFVVVQHLDPAHESFMAELLGRCTAMPVVQVKGKTPIEPNHVYCIPPGRFLAVRGRTLGVTAPVESTTVRMPIDFFFRALAVDAEERAIGVVLSGTGSDGTLGLRAIMAAGGLALVQDPATAQHDGMLRSAIAAGAADHVLSPEQIPDRLREYVGHPYARGAVELGAVAGVEGDSLGDVLAILRDRTKFDFGSYKRKTIERRIGRRMGLKHVERIDDYVRVLTDEPAEAARLFDDLLITVTGFFRDPEVWRQLSEDVIRPLVLRKEAGEALRVWVPACATGEEAYSIAMLVIDALQAAGKARRAEIFASDVDTGALGFARAGLYPESIVAGVPPKYLRRFFVEEGAGFRVTAELRESVLFARQNLLADPPFSRIDLVSCRNVLMYLDPEAQKKVLALLHFALVDGGHLLLGSAETVAQQEDLYEVVSKSWRIYRRVGPTRHDRIEFASARDALSGRPVDQPPSDPARLGLLAQQRLLERFVPACVLIDRNFQIRYFAGPTQDYLLQPTGVPTEHLTSRLREGLQPKVRAAVRAATNDLQRVVVSGARVRRAEGWHGVQVTVEPFGRARETDGLMLVAFVDEPPMESATPRSSGDAIEPDEGLVRQLEHELESAREDLQITVQDVESSNQELRVANEEIMSVNEELRSSNEELETSKEELQSLNEELHTVNTQLEDKIDQLERTNNDLDNLLTSTKIATIFLDTELRVRRFTPTATELFGLLPADVGRPIADVAQRCTDPALHEQAEAVLSSALPMSSEVQCPDGRWFVRQVLPYSTRNGRMEGVVITFSDVAADVLREARVYAEAIVDTVREPLVVLDADLRVQSANRPFYEMFQLAPEATQKRPIYELGDGQLDVPRLRRLLGDVLESKGILENFEIQHEFATLGRRVLLLNARRLVRGGGRADLILLAIEDVTERKAAEQRLRESEAMTRAGIRTAVDGVIAMDERGVVLSFNPAAEHMFGYTGGEVVGQTIAMLLPAPFADDRAGELMRHLEGMEPGVRGTQREVNARRKDGTRFPCDLHVGEYQDGTGRCFVATLRDITERKQTEEHVRRQQAEMAHVLRVATIERLAAGLAHELNQPLTAIANDIEACATYLRTGKVAPRRLLGLLDRAGAEALRAGEIVHHLRAYVQRGEPRFEPANLTEIVRNATRWLEREMERGRITLRLDVADRPLPIVGDRVQLEQVMVNLLQNAIDAVREADHERRDIHVRTAQVGDGTVQVSVEDTGIGLSAAAAERLYEPFFTTKPEGMGMGLAISRTIVEMHHGQLLVESRATGSGTTVRLTLPVDRVSRVSQDAK